MTDEYDRCDGCGALLVNRGREAPAEEVMARLENLGYNAQDAYHDFEDGRTYHGHALEDDRADHDGFGEARQGHDSDQLHSWARDAFEEAPTRCPRHYGAELAFTKSVSPYLDNSELFAQGKCPECEYVALVSVEIA